MRRWFAVVGRWTCRRVERRLAVVPLLRRHRMRSLLVLLLLGLGAPVRPDDPASWQWIAWGVGVVLAGSLLHLAAKGYLQRTGVLVTSGPYRLVRHPFYLANIIIDAGICLMGANPFVAVPYLMILGVQTVAVVDREERALLREHGDAMRAYRAAVPVLIPWKIPRRVGEVGRVGQTQSFSRANLALELEVSRFLRILAIPPLLLLALLLKANLIDGRPLLEGALLLKVSLLAGGATLRAGSLLLRGIPPRKISSQLEGMPRRTRTPAPPDA